MVKRISENFYVYEYKTVKGEDGKRHTKMGKLIGYIKEGIGFIPNNNFICDQEITTLDYGEYAIAFVNSKGILLMLNECFNPQDAALVYVVSLIHFLQGFIRRVYNPKYNNLPSPRGGAGFHPQKRA